MQHIEAVLFVLHPQAESESGVAPNIIVHRTARLLRSKDEVYTEASAYLRNAYEFTHEFRLLALKLSEFVDHYEEVWDGLSRIAAFVKLGVTIDVVYTAVSEYPLPAAVLTLYGYHRPLDLVAREVGYLAGHMRQTIEEMGHTTTLVVDNEELYIVWAVVDGKRKYICLESLTLARSCGTCHQPMRPVIFLVYIEIHRRPSGLLPDKSFNVFVCPALGPEFFDRKFFRALYTLHLEECERCWYLSARLLFEHAKLGQPSCEALQIGSADIVEVDGYARVTS